MKEPLFKKYQEVKTFCGSCEVKCLQRDKIGHIVEIIPNETGHSYKVSFGFLKCTFQEVQLKKL